MTSKEKENREKLWNETEWEIETNRYTMTEKMPLIVGEKNQINEWVQVTSLMGKELMELDHSYRRWWMGKTCSRFNK